MTITLQSPESTTTVLTVDEAAAAVLAERATLAEWQGRLEDARSDLDATSGKAGAALLANPGAEVELAGRLTQVKERVGLIEQAIAAQQPRVLLAESRYLAAQAAAHEAAVVEARAALDEHQAKTQRLLKALEQHEGEYVSRASVIESAIASGADASGVSWREPKSHALQRALFTARLHVAVLQEMAAGRDPADLRTQPEWRKPGCFADNQNLDFYPACVVGPDALVLARSFVERVHGLRAHIAELEELARSLPVEIADWERRLHAAEVAGQIKIGVDEHGGPRAHATASFDGASLNAGHGLDEPSVTLEGLHRRCARLEAIDDELIAARRALAEMTGEDAGA